MKPIQGLAIGAFVAVLPLACALPAQAAELTADQQGTLEVKLSQSAFAWDGSAKKPAVEEIEVWDTSGVATTGEDLEGSYQVDGRAFRLVGYKSNKNIGTAYVTLECLLDGMQGTWNVPFKIEVPAVGTVIPAKFASDGNAYIMESGGSVTLKSYKSSKKTARIGKVRFGGRSFTVAGIGAKAFSKKKLTKAVLGSSVGAVGAKAFSGCKKLASVQLGTGVARIGKQAFKGCKKLKTLIVKSSKLTRAGVKGSLKGSKLKTVRCKKVTSVRKSLYKDYFAKGNSGRKVTVR